MISHNVPALLSFCRSPSVHPPPNNEHFRVTYERTNRGSTVIADNNGGGRGRQTKNVTRQRKWEIDLSGGLGMEFRMTTRVRTEEGEGRKCDGRRGFRRVTHALDGIDDSRKMQRG